MRPTIFYIGSILDRNNDADAVLRDEALKHDFNFITATFPDIAKATTSFDSICTHVAAELSQLEAQGAVFIIAYSSGAEVLFNLNLPPTVRAAELWSPSFFYQQAVAETLAIDPTDQDLLVLPNTCRISRRLAHDLDQRNTEQSREHLTIPYRVFLDCEADPRVSWQNATQTNYTHTYTSEQLTERLAGAVAWFSSFVNEPL